MTKTRHYSFNKKALSILLALVMCLSVLAMGVSEMLVVRSFAAVTALTEFNASAGDELNTGRYIVKTSKSLSGSGTNGLKIKAGATVLLYIPEGVTLTVTGANGGNATAGGSPANATATANNEGSNSPAGTAGAGGGGGYAGILVPSNSTLIITGKGTLKATGGKGGNAGAGGKGANAACVSATSVRDARTGGGGGGGGGAGGGGAGIGTNGGSGGAGGTGGAGFMKEGSNYVGIVNADGDTTGNPGGDGSVGGDAVACGTIYKLGNVTVTATAGAGGSASTSGGGAGSRDNTGKDTPRLCASGGAGGGAGGAGKAGADVGTGGGGGGGAGGGGGGGYWYSSKKAYGWRYANKGTGGSSGGANGTNASGDNDQGNWSTGGSGKDQGADASSKSYASGTPSYAQITVTLDRQGGTTGDTSVTCIIGFDMPEANMPTKGGYTFDGYFTETSGGTKYYNADGSSAHVWDGSAGTLYAHWTINDYTATFKADDIPDPDNALHDSPNDSSPDYDVESTFTFPTGLDKDYYVFDGVWKVTGSEGESNWTTGDTYTAGSTSPTGKYGNVTFRAQYTPVDYLLTFDPNGGSAIISNYDSATDTNHYKYNYECRTRPATPASLYYTMQSTLPTSTWLGYTLVGWQPITSVGSWDASQVYPAGTSLKGMHGNVTLKAKWASETSTVTLNINTAAGEAIQGNTSLSYAFAESLTLNNPTKTGYTFTGWKVTTVPNSYPSSVPVANRWVINTTYELGSEANVVLDAGKIGNVTLTPMWEHIKYTITYAGNNGTTPDAKDYYIDSTAFNLPGSTRNGYDFDGWTVTAHDEVYNWTASSYAYNYSVSGKYGSVTLTAQWKAHEYTITLDVNDGDAITPNTRSYKTTESTGLPTPTRTGYTFKGWKVTNPGADTNWVDGTVYSVPPQVSLVAPSGFYGNVTLTAQWEHETYTITKSTSGTNGGDKTYHIDDAAFTLGSSVLAGYEFLNWKVTSADANSNWTVDDTYNADTSISGKYGNVTVEAQFSPVTSYITYQNPDGTQYAQDPYTIQNAVTIRNYAKDGYTFNGWTVVSADADCWPSVDSVIAGAISYNAGEHYGNVTLKAKLTPINYEVTFDANGGLPLAKLPYNIESAGESDVLPEPTRNGYDFDGWKVTTAAGNWAENATFAAGAAVTGQWGSPTLTAQWTPKKYTITYYTGAYPGGITKQGTFGQTAPDLTDDEKAKPADAQYTYTFDHWEPALATVTGETSYTAVYTSTVNKYVVTWMIPTDVSGTPGNYTGTDSDPIEYGETPVYNNGVNPTLNSANESEYTWRFAGWSLTAGGAKLESLPAVTGNATYYALFTKVLAPEIVNWVINGVTNSEEWGIGETPEWRHDTPTKPDEDGYRFVFDGWDPQPVPVAQHGGPYTYTAQFHSEKQDYTITLALNGGATEAALEYPYQLGDTVTFPAPTRTGYTFAGWLLDAAAGNWEAGTNVPAGDYATGTKWGNVSFTAQWTPIEYTISFNASGDNNVLPDALTYTIESTNAIPAAVREGYTLNGWIVSVGGGNWTQGATIAAAYELLNNYGNITLTPVWQVKTYTLTWISGDYTQTSEAEYGSAILAYTPISKMGYTADWDSEVPATMPASDLTFTAVYTPVDYYIRLNVNGGSPLDNFYYTIEGCSANQTPTLDALPTPTRAGATFVGWKVAAAQGNWVRNAVMAGGASLNGKYGNVSLTAQWDLERHTVTWVAGDVTKETVWLYGAVPSYDGVPYKSPDESHSYVFVGWALSPEGDTLEELSAVTQDITYYAQFNATERKYAVTWFIDGATTTEYYSYGATPVYPGESDPVRPSTSEYDFTFNGWSPAVGEVTGDVTYVAQFDVFTKLQGLSIDVSSLVLEIGEGGVVQAQIYPSTATVKDVVWTSKNTDVATVSDTGEITAVSNGIALINVASVDRSFNAYCVVTVKPRHTNYVAITANGVSTTQLPGAMLQLSATLQPENATDTGIRWSSGDITVATVDQTGLVKFVGVGETDIVAVASDGFSLGSIHVVTTADESEVEDTVKTYRVTFGENNAGYVFTEGGEAVRNGYMNVPEGETVRFKLAVDDDYQTRYSVYANMSRIRYGSDFWYEIENVHDNVVVSVKNASDGGGIPDQPDDGGSDNGAKLSFFERLAQFLRKIVEFFRSIFKK